MATDGGGRMAEVVLFAEFDIDKGSTLRESYPQALPHYSPEFFADVMLPEGVHNRQEDFTIFFLNRKNATKHLLATAADIPAGAGDGDVIQNDVVVDSDRAITPGADAAGGNNATDDPLKEFMYCISVVHTTYDTSVRRGAKVKAVAICSRHKVCVYVCVCKLLVCTYGCDIHLMRMFRLVLQFCFSFKDVLSVAAGKLSAMKDDVDAMKILQDLYEVVNAVDTSGVRNLSDMERRLLKRTVSSNGRSGAKDLEESLYFRTHAQWHDQRISLQFKLCSTDDQYDDGLLRKLLLKFGEQTMLIYNAVLTGARVIVLGYNQAAGMCNL